MTRFNAKLDDKNRLFQVRGVGKKGHIYQQGWYYQTLYSQGCSKTAFKQVSDKVMVFESLKNSHLYTINCMWVCYQASYLSSL